MNEIGIYLVGTSISSTDSEESLVKLGVECIHAYSENEAKNIAVDICMKLIPGTLEEDIDTIAVKLNTDEIKSMLPSLGQNDIDGKNKLISALIVIGPAEETEISSYYLLIDAYFGRTTEEVYSMAFTDMSKRYPKEEGWGDPKIITEIHSKFMLKSYLDEESLISSDAFVVDAPQLIQ